MWPTLPKRDLYRTSTGTPSGPCWVRSWWANDGQQRARADQWMLAKTAGRSAYRPLTSYGGEGRSGVRVSCPQGCRGPPAALATKRWPQGIGLTLRSSWQPSPPGGGVVALVGRATRVP